ncbi:hypothetical protein [Streptomyces mobaraensis]|uniref:hypothetical protein n=1 Tax=Streptomyces mobaraensis TaxID=35621 RepID=UPI003D9F53BD
MPVFAPMAAAGTAPAVNVLDSRSLPAGSRCGHLIGRKAGGVLLARGRSPRPHEGAERAEALPARCGHAKAVTLALIVAVSPLPPALEPYRSRKNPAARTKGVQQ